MPREVHISVVLPFRLPTPGSFPTSANGSTLVLTTYVRLLLEGALPTTTRAHVAFETPDELTEAEQLRVQNEQANHLVRTLNRFLRWYRACYRATGVFEVTRAQVSPFSFRTPLGEKWGEELNFEPAQFSYDSRPDSIGQYEQVFRGFASGGEPEVADLAIIDSIEAMNGGRFREAVLLCWSAIDATFTRRFESLVDERLSSEWSEAKRFLKGFDFGLRQKMTTGMRLLTGQSFYELPNGFWGRLSDSYALRNRIIHAGSSASEDDARKSIDVANELVRLMRSL